MIESAVSMHIDSWLLAGFAITLTLWAAASISVVVNRLLFDRRQRRRTGIVLQLTAPGVASLAPSERSEAVRRILARLSILEVYQMSSSADFPPWLLETCAAYSVEHVGLGRVAVDATPRRGQRKWRRISALSALGHMRSAGAHALLAAAVRDPDNDIAGAAAAILRRIGDRGAAEILVSALREGSPPQSRVATHLDQFPIPIDDLLRPLLAVPEPGTRFWAVSLLGRYPGVDGLVAEIAERVDDPHPPVRKEALATLGAMAGTVAVRTARGKLEDSVPYVRSMALRVLGQRGSDETDVDRRRVIAGWITPSLADSDWEVRLAAKEGLTRLGIATWREIAVELESPDAFARNGAAEVLQNLGLLDWTLRGLGSGVEPSAELVDVVKRALREGGPAMARAASRRLEPEPLPGIERLVPGLRFASVES